MYKLVGDLLIYKKLIKTSSNTEIWILNPQLIVLLSVVGLSLQQDDGSATVLRFDNVIGPETGQYEYAYETSNGIKEEVCGKTFVFFSCLTNVISFIFLGARWGWKICQRIFRVHIPRRWSSPCRIHRWWQWLSTGRRSTSHAPSRCRQSNRVFEK